MAPLFVLTVSVTLFAVPLAADLTTEGERSGWKRTGRYAEATALCRRFAQAFPGRARCEAFGETPEGRQMVALVAGRPSSTRPVVYLQGGIHSGEIDGKDAGFWLLRELLSGKEAPGLLDRVTVVFVPVLNPDGHERFGPNNRVNQRGPEQMGFRTTAQNLNLNRDHTKADAPEMAALLRLLKKYDPLLYVDLHVTDGAKFQPDVAVIVEPRQYGSPRLRPAAQALQDAVFPALREKGHHPLDFYPAFLEDDQPASGFAYGVAPPRFSQGYWPLRNRFAVLVEAHSWKDYATRVRATYDTCLAVLSAVAEQASALREAARQADLDDERGAQTEVALAWKEKPGSRRLSFPGYAYTRTLSDVSGAQWIRYDEAKPEAWDLPFFPEVQPAATAKKPAGYLVPPAHAWLVEKLAQHGLKAQKLRSERAVDVEVFRATSAQFQPKPYEGRQLLTVKGAWAKERRTVPAGSWFVPTAQRGAQLLVHLLEPGARDSFLSWGFFNAHFEQKEYMEPYVAEEVARQLLQEPAVKAEFERRLKEDAAFAKDPAARLEFFYRRHPSWDERMNLYPVFRVEDSEAALGRSRQDDIPLGRGVFSALK